MNLKKLSSIFFVLSLVFITSCNDIYTVMYDGNGSTGGIVPTDSNNYEEGATVTVISVGELVKAGETFTGWNTAADGSGTARLVGSTFVMGADNVTLYAQWTNNPTYRVIYDGNGNTGGSVPTDSNNYEEGATITVASASASGLVKTGKIFSGWNTAADGSGTLRTVASSFAMATADVTLFAQWATPRVIGEAYQGGVVAYVLQVGDPGYVEGEQHGLIAAATNQSTGIQWAVTDYWYTAVPGGTLTTIGSGSTNTDKIIAQNGVGITYAAGLARACSDGGYTDWYLPSKEELNKLYLNRIAIGNFTSNSYWSSSEFNTYFAEIQDFSDGDQAYTDKLAVFCYVRAVRSF